MGRHRRGGLSGHLARSVLLACAALAAVAVVAACGSSSSSSDTGSGKASKTLVINSFGGEWGDALQKGVIDDFERQTGIKVTLLSTADASKSKLAVQSGNKPPEDLIDTDYPTVAAMANSGLLAPINYKRFDQSTLTKLPANAKQQYGVAWGGFAIALCYDKRKFPNNPPNSWADFWNFNAFPGNRGMIEWPVEPQPEFGLIAAGVSITQVYPIDEKKAFAQLQLLRPHVPKFASDPASLQQQMLDGTVSMEACYSHRVQKLIDGGVQNIGISYNGARLSNDYFMVWKNAPNRDNAIKFLDYLLSAKAQANWARIGDTAPVNPDAFKMLPKNVQAKLATAPQYRDKEFVQGDRYYSAMKDGKTNQQRIIDEWGNLVGG